MHPALEAIRLATIGTPFESDLWLVGGAVRDELLGISHDADFDLVTGGDAGELARHLYTRSLSSIPPVIYERFGTAMVRVLGTDVEIVTARRESYAEGSRKPTVERATIEDDAARRDFTVNTLLRSLHRGELHDPLGTGLEDLRSGLLRTPLDPVETFRDDPLRMLRAVRFRWKLGFEPADGLYEAIRATRERLRIVSLERVHDELEKMIEGPSPAKALADLMNLGLFEIFAPELVAMKGCEQGKWHHLDVWDHSLLVVENLGESKVDLLLAGLLHDIGKPATRMIDENNDVRFFGHETVGAEMAGHLLRRLKFSHDLVDRVVLLVRNHMRLGSFKDFSPAAARRLIRDVGEQVDDLLKLVQADAESLKPGVKIFDGSQIKERVAQVRTETPREKLQSPLSGLEIMQHLNLAPSKRVGEIKELLTEQVLEGTLDPDDKMAARNFLSERLSDGS